ncbi:DMT family transporter [Pseudomonas rubra]|uniref:DMT family transporter n=1 Tax=Pseudomonas rubra TaxID=2942627 RepID=A0ABT5P3E6_9PSED|nr:DMT family transporter [Pseudomonas rubra]MDD1012697.1 DMT family transporter [Pseudomonas rubra]MDD1041595.1 DMT family transporter [Pseudomonas rubra]MDD1155531.1 DMT family transporter [Pseudomonas rubra]
MNADHNNKKPRSLIAPLMFVGCLMIWSTNWIAISLQVERSDIGSSLMLRFLIAYLVLWLCQRLFGTVQAKVTRSAYLQMACVGAVYFYAGIGLAYLATAYLGSAQMACLSALVIFYIIGLKRLLFKAPVAIHSLVGGLVSLLGLGLFMLGDDARPLSLPGTVLALTSFLGVALGSVLSEHIQRSHGLGTLHINKVAAGWACALYALSLLLTGKGLQLPSTLVDASILLYLGVICSALVFVLFIDLIKRVGAENAGYVGVLYPIGASYLSVWLGETPLGLHMMIGSALVMLGSLINFKCRYNPGLKKLEFS